MGKIVLGTSIAPFNVEKQKLAVESWIKNGFRVVSCNVKEEINVLESLFEYDELEFVEIERSAIEYAGKALPYIHDILVNASYASDTTCGYINSDIILCDLPNGMCEWIEKEAESSLLFAHRHEIIELIDIYEMNWKMNFDGIDLFFVDKNLVNDFFDEDFFVQSSWDLALLPNCMLKNVKMKQIINPIAFHKRHTVSWNLDRLEMMLLKFGKKYFSMERSAYEEFYKMYYRILCDNVQQICFELTDFYGEEHIYEINPLSERRTVFKALATYLLNYFKCPCLKINNYFVSVDDEGQYFNELNRSMQLLEKINAENELFNKVSVNGIATNEEVVKVVTLPISYIVIDTQNEQYIERIRLTGDTYIMPAGIRGSEWYNWVGKKLKLANIVGFIDNSAEKAGKVLETLPIRETSNVVDKKPEFNVVIASKFYGLEIMEQMTKYIPESRLFNANCILGIEDGQIVYFRQEKFSSK